MFHQLHKQKYGTYFQELFEQNKEVSQLLNIKPDEIKSKIQDFKVQQSKTDKKSEATNKVLAKYLLDSLDSKKIVYNETTAFIGGGQIPIFSPRYAN